jgi:predicted DNA-binding ribbon-helix-helix protein
MGTAANRRPWWGEWRGDIAMELSKREANGREEIETTAPREADLMRKHSVVIAGHRTSVSLEEAFWSGLREIAEKRKVSVNRLVESIDTERSTNLSSAVRVFVLRHYREHLALSREPSAYSILRLVGTDPRPNRPRI